MAVLKNDSFKEYCLLEIKPKGRDKLIFGCFYRSPTADNDSDLNNENLNSLIDTIFNNKDYSHKCLLGHNWTTNKCETSEESKFLECVTSNHLYQHISKPTRCRGNDDPSIIDLLFTNEEMQISNLEHHSPLGASDHSVITFDFNFHTEQPTASTKYTTTQTLQT